MTLKTRLALWYTGVLLVVLLACAWVLLQAQPRIGAAYLDEELRAAGETVAGLIQAELDEGEPAVAAASEVLAELAPAGRGFAVFAADGRLLAARWGALEPLADTLPLAPTENSSWTVQTPAGPARLLIRPLGVPPAAYRLAVITSLAPVAREGAILRRAVLAAIPLALLLVGLGGWLATAQALRPVGRMAREAQAIAARDPAARLTTGSGRDELARLAVAFNGVLDRLAAALDQQRRFMADASHELRTPVSIVKTAAEVTLAQPARSEPEYRDALAAIAAQTRRLALLVEDMFALALADAGRRPLDRRDFYADELVDECARSLRVLAEPRGVTMVTRAGPDLLVHADEGLVRQLLVNLLDNAVRHSREGGAVTTEADEVDGWVRLRVTDAGPGIPEADRARVFDRFVKLDAARTGDGGGAGLGLSIARWVAEAHGGRLELARSDATGSVFEAWLPRHGGEA